MGFDFDDIKGLLGSLLDEVIEDAKNTGRELWDNLEGEQVEQAKTALKRYGENNLDALRNPDQSETYLASAAHNLNELINIGATTKIQARQEARALLDRIYAKLIDTATAAIDVLL